MKAVRARSMVLERCHASQARRARADATGSDQLQNSFAASTTWRFRVRPGPE